MTPISEFITLKNQISKLIANQDKDQGQALDILKKLDSMDITPKILSSTLIAITVNEFRKFSTDKQTQRFSKTLIKKWKNLNDAARSGNKEKTTEKKKVQEITKKNSKTPAAKEENDHEENTEKKKVTRSIKKKSKAPVKKQENDHEEKPKKKEVQENLEMLVKESGPEPVEKEENGHEKKNEKKKVQRIIKKKSKAPAKEKENDHEKKPKKKEVQENVEMLFEDPEPVIKEEIDRDIRNKSKNMIFNALGVDERLKDQNIKQLAEELEKCIFDGFGNTGRDYRYTIISRSLNLKDPKNPDLRMRFGLGSITPACMAILSNEDMASEAKKALRASYGKKGIRKSRMATAQGTNTSLLKCGKCKKNNCTYNQMQTRSADEPMTTFVVCNNCQNRWKF